MCPDWTEVHLRASVAVTGFLVLMVPAMAMAEGAPLGRCSLTALGGVRLLLSRSAVSDVAAADPAEFDKRWRRFARAAGVVLGAEVGADPATHDDYLAAFKGIRVVTVACDALSVSRDRTAYRLGLLGYSLEEIGGIISGTALRADIDAAAVRHLAGLPPRPLPSTLATLDVATGPVSVGEPHRWPDDGSWITAAAATLSLAPPLTSERATAPSTLASLRSPTAAPGFPVVFRPGVPASASAAVSRAGSSVPIALEWWTRYYSMAYGVDYRLVAAVIRQESNWQSASVSAKGAVGLMQLMPATAAMLRVNPRDPVDNLRGGIAYLAGLLNNYGNVRSALIAYNAGSVHADQVLRGEREPFPETQRYLSAVDAIYPINARR